MVEEKKFSLNAKRIESYDEPSYKHCHHYCLNAKRIESAALGRLEGVRVRLVSMQRGLKGRRRWEYREVLSEVSMQRGLKEPEHPQRMYP